LKAAPAPDLVGRDFTAKQPGTKLVEGIIYLPTIEDWWYSATVIDLATREVIGYAMACCRRLLRALGGCFMIHEADDLFSSAMVGTSGRGGPIGPG
jgi:transposase InsO family protein